MDREIIITLDGSSSIYIPAWKEHYHSHHGAIQEAKHVFIKNGLLEKSNEEELKILEVGFGTGLNCLLTLQSKPKNQQINYHGLEAFPLEKEEIAQLNYRELLEQNTVAYFENLHQGSWNEVFKVEEFFILHKIQMLLLECKLEVNSFDLIYFDAFGPRVQPEMWTIEIFEKMFACMKKDGIFVTYCAKGQVKRDLKAVGFEVETLPGPPGKREMIRAWN